MALASIICMFGGLGLLLLIAGLIAIFATRSKTVGIVLVALGAIAIAVPALVYLYVATAMR